MNPHLWMLTRKHPPSVGGMQQLSYHLAEELRARRPVTVIAWGRGQWGLPIFFATAFVRVLLGLATRRISVLHLGDPALAALAWLPKRCGVPVLVTVHGLDITFRSAFYQRYLRWFFWGRMDAYACISRHVAALVLAAGIEPERVEVIPVGMGSAPTPGVLDATLEARLAMAFPVLTTVGRLVERKGVHWFLAAVAAPWLARHPSARLVVAGDGPMRGPIERLVESLGLGAQVSVLGAIDEAGKWALLDRTHLVLMPNIPVAGDAEGFGLVVLEAASAGCYVAAADLEGLRDAVTEGRNGTRIEAANAPAWSAALDSLCADPAALRARGEAAKAYVADHYSWPVIGASYAAMAEALESHAA